MRQLNGKLNSLSRRLMKLVERCCLGSMQARWSCHSKIFDKYFKLQQATDDKNDGDNFSLLQEVMISNFLQNYCQGLHRSPFLSCSLPNQFYKNILLNMLHFNMLHFRYQSLWCHPILACINWDVMMMWYHIQIQDTYL